MMKLICISLIAGCAAGPHGRLAATEAIPLAPAPIDTDMPATTRLSNQLRQQFGERAVEEVRVCSRPSGKVSSVTAVGGAELSAFELAVVEDVSHWRFEPTPGPDSLERCAVQTIAFYPHK
jgi:hypothetical protein